MMEAPPRGFDEIDVGAGQRQTAASRFGEQAIEEIKSFVYQPPGGMDDDDDDEEDEEDGNGGPGDDDDDDGDDDDDNDEEEDVTMEDPEQPDTVQEGGGSAGQAFPRMARLRMNLTAMSQRYNLYFVAYQDKIHVFQPKRAPQILPGPSLVLNPRKSKAGRLIHGTIDRSFGHQMNNIMVGNLGDFEVVFFAFDDGDVGAYYTHAISYYILASKRQSSPVYRRVSQPSPKGQSGAIQQRGPQPPKEFFHDNVGLSAWGLAIHEQSRLLAVSSNGHEVTVFAFATTEDPNQDRESDQEEDTSPQTWSGQTALSLERHFQSRSRTWRIVLPLPPEGRNIPALSFCDDETGYAEKIVAVDIEGNTWILDIWKIGCYPILLKSTSNRAWSRDRYIGWGVLVLPERSFRQTRTLLETFGVPPREIILPRHSPKTTTSNNNKEPEFWLDTTCSLYYIRDLASDPDDFLPGRHSATIYTKTHRDYLKASNVQNDDADSYVSSYLELPAETSDSDDEPPGPAVMEYSHLPGLLPAPDQSGNNRWALLSKRPGSPLSRIDDLSSDVQLSRTIVPSSGETPFLNGSLAKPLIHFANENLTRAHNIRSVKFSSAKISSFIAKNMTILRTTATGVELQPMTPNAPSIVCHGVLTHHNHLKRRNEPWDLARHVSERISMVLHVPELNLVVVGALHGRVALLTLTNLVERGHDGPVSRKKGFRVEWVLPRRNEEENRLRPLCALHGIAISPVPGPRAQNLELHGRRMRALPVRYRLILHYIDHTILMYNIGRRSEEEDLMIF